MLKADASALKNLGKQLRKADTTMYKATQASLRVVGRRVADRAVANASQFAKTPPKGSVSASGVNAVIVRAGGDGADWKAIENHGKGHVRHPVFGDRQKWTEKNSPPAFLLPAATVGLRRSADELAEALTVEVEKMVHGVERFI